MLVDYSLPNRQQQINEMLLEYGFTVLKHHPLDSAFITHIYQQWAAFFSSKNKGEYLYNQQTCDGYYPMLSETAKNAQYADFKEYYMYYPSGQCPETLRQDTQHFYKQLGVIADDILTILWNNLPNDLRQSLPKPFAKMMDTQDTTVLRILHYPPIDNLPPGSIRAQAHKDISLITLIPRTTSEGLQLKKQDQWLEIPFDKDWITLNIGDMLQEYTRGFYTSTSHRVLNPKMGENTARLSMPFFVHANNGEFISDRYPKQELFLRERLAENGVIAKA